MSSTPTNTDSYKGVRDFYPEDMRRRAYMFSVMRTAVQRFGYQEIAGSVLEPANLYEAKSGQEIVEEQSYRFEDRGGREVMLRPEMTPTVARMIAKKAKSLPFPVRWYSIPNLFRYEAPQRGRLREHWQLNADILGVESNLADVEIISLAYAVLTEFGAREDEFIIHISSRPLFSSFCQEELGIEEKEKQDVMRLVDKRKKMDNEDFNKAVSDLLDEEAVDQLLTYLSAGDLNTLIDEFPNLEDSAQSLKEIMTELKNNDIGNAVFDPALVRGLDYYTGMVFEVFDTHPKNSRSIFGGGRYDNLVDMFDSPSVPAVGFGLGDVTLADFLDVHELWPELTASIDVAIALVDRNNHAEFGNKVAAKLRDFGLNVTVDISDTSVGTQLKHADQAKAQYAIIIGDEEMESKEVTIKNMSAGTQETVAVTNILDLFKDEK